MKSTIIFFLKSISISLFIAILCLHTQAQTDADAIMMTKNNFCVGGMYGFSSWKDYWEGTLKRNNENLGTVTMQSMAIMGNYGIKDNLNVLFGLPYIKTKASAGQLKGQKGIQDISLWIKWMPFEKEVGPGTLSLYIIGGYSMPVSDYVADFLPMSIGLRSKNISLRGMVDYQVGSWFATLSGTYVRRSNVTIDRTAYFTTEMHYTNQVKMPDATMWQLRTGYRNGGWIAEALLDNWTTRGGFDITRNNMPFLSNRMNATRAGINLKYENGIIDGLSLIGGGNYTLAGRNTGKTFSVNAGIFYILDFSKKEKKTLTSESEDKKN
jgi:hypothetical protein